MCTYRGPENGRSLYHNSLYKPQNRLCGDACMCCITPEGAFCDDATGVEGPETEGTWEPLVPVDITGLLVDNATDVVAVLPGDNGVVA